MPTPKGGTLAGAFASYQADVIPRNADSVQIQECRRAFYAGAWALINRIDECKTLAAIVLDLDFYAAECRQFNNDVLAGKK